MPYVSPTEIRNAGNWSVAEAPDAALTQLVTAADAWIDKILGTTYTTYLAANATNGAVAHSAEIYFAAYLFSIVPPKDDFKIGPAESKSNAAAKLLASEKLLSTAKTMLGIIDKAFESWSFSWAGGDDYHPTGEDDTNIDIQSAMEEGEDYPLNVLGVSLDD
jgi:hypothetical protein